MSSTSASSLFMSFPFSNHLILVRVAEHLEPGSVKLGLRAREITQDGMLVHGRIPCAHTHTCSFTPGEFSIAKLHICMFRQWKDSNANMGRTCETQERH